MSEKTQTEPRKVAQFLATTLATLSALAMGLCLTWTSPALPMLEQPTTYPKITKNQGAWIGSLLTLGAFCGAIPAGTLANFIGRKRSLLFFALPLFISWIIIAYGNCVGVLYFARFLAGLAIGAISVAAPMYVTEIAHTSIRGTLGTFFQVQITVGVLVGYILGTTIESFQYLALVSSVFPLLFVSGFAFMPETPAYLYATGRIDAARKSLIFFRGRDYNLLDEELQKIAEDIKESTANKPKLSDLIRNRVTLNGLVVSLGLMAFQQLSGVNAVLFYAGNIFAETGNSMGADTCAVLVGAVQVIATLLSTVLIDKTGRKILLLVSSSIMCLSLLALGLYFFLKQTQDLSFLSALPLVSLAVFIVVFSIGMGPIPWLMMGEIFTPKSKGVATSVSAAFNWVMAFTVTNQYQNLNEMLGVGGTFMAFGGICALGVLFIALLVPETKGKDIDQVQEALMRTSRV
ncbi:Facilitated trehalose transporter Tret1-2 homolog-like Protein [Tribolium castaneum]|uniref:Facilitated trehalose transporter Tret1-2 homolog-like Protein n=2 Tax=Tribolium castaneum TaxID=7070 RepID=D6X0Y1_TRICA|nr:Facilitated trehalose transporter Tret1-2 homolog-like Protein [Tribolium castaneum]